MDRIVDVFIDGELLTSYALSLTHLDKAIADAALIAEAKECMREDDYPEDAIDEATFLVRKP